MKTNQILHLSATMGNYAQAKLVETLEAGVSLPEVKPEAHSIIIDGSALVHPLPHIPQRHLMRIPEKIYFPSWNHTAGRTITMI